MKKVVGSISGHWDGQLIYRDEESKEEEVLYDFDASAKYFQVEAVNIPKASLPTDSLVVWSRLSAALTRKDMKEANRIKNEIEEEQRRIRKERAKRHEEFQPRFFRLKDGMWVPRDEMHDFQKRCMPRLLESPSDFISINLLLHEQKVLERRQRARVFFSQALAADLIGSLVKLPAPSCQPRSHRKRLPAQLSFPAVEGQGSKRVEMDVPSIRSSASLRSFALLRSSPFFSPPFLRSSPFRFLLSCPVRSSRSPLSSTLLSSPFLSSPLSCSSLLDHHLLIDLQRVLHQLGGFRVVSPVWRQLLPAFFRAPLRLQDRQVVHVHGHLFPVSSPAAPSRHLGVARAEGQLEDLQRLSSQPVGLVAVPPRLLPQPRQMVQRRGDGGMRLPVHQPLDAAGGAEPAAARKH
eukprot:762128-Hanusia_phi.AAC.3